MMIVSSDGSSHLWGMHSSRVAAANDARAGLQRLDDMMSTSAPFAVFHCPLLTSFH